MSKHNEYKPGNPEYDYWNDKNLYPSLRYDESHLRTQRPTELDNPKVGLGAVVLAVFVWILIFAPVALFLTWGNWLTQVIFWGGWVIIMLIFVMWACSAIEEYRAERNVPKKSEDDPDLPWYKKYPPADVRKKK